MIFIQINDYKPVNTNGGEQEPQNCEKIEQDGVSSQHLDSVRQE
jgi:hypothetical protein